MSKPDSWMPLYVADYIADTTRLTTEQHGAYLLLIIDYWRNGPPPNDDGVLARITGLTLPRWKAHRPTIQQFFQIAGKTWQHKRVNHEFEKATGISKAKQTAGRLGGEAKAKAVAERLANDLANAKQTPTPSPSPSQESLPGPSPAPSPAQTSTPVEPRAKSRPNGSPARSAAVFEAYANAYHERYGVDPVRNAKVNSAMCQLVDRLGEAEAIEVAAFYVRHNQAFYVRDKHSAGMLLRDAEGLRTEWATGNRVTETQARQADRTQANGDVFGKLIAEAEAREKAA